MLINIFRVLSLLLLASLIAGCSGYSSAVNALGPKAPQSDMRAEVEAPLTLSQKESPFCAKPIVVDAPEIQRVMATLPEPYRATLYFVFDTSRLTTESEVAAQNVFEQIKSRQLAEVTVVGHTDTVGSTQYNTGLSERRADGVQKELVKRGVPEHIIRTRGAGEYELLIETADNVAEPRNRRVEIDVR